ncbi:hypothetical protein PGB90_003933 [Kerria lacca]
MSSTNRKNLKSAPELPMRSECGLSKQSQKKEREKDKRLRISAQQIGGKTHFTIGPPSKALSITEDSIQLAVQQLTNMNTSLNHILRKLKAPDKLLSIMKDSEGIRNTISKGFIG